MPNNVSFALLLALLAGLSTGIGSLIAYFMRKPKDWQLSLILGFSAGVMIYVSFAELLHAAVGRIGFVNANLGFFIGIAFIAILDILVPHEYKQERVGSSGFSSVAQDKTGQGSDVQPVGSLSVEQKSNLRRAGILIALGIAIHNFPEGLAVFSGAVTGDRTFGILIAVAIALHNIPEGISVSVPISEATGNRRRAFLYSFLAGLAEPVGAIIGYAVLFAFLTPSLIYSLLAFSAGIMVYISLDEILPTAQLYGRQHFVILGVLAGMLVMAISIFLLR
ncbi:MAG: zinc transporter ZupT [Dehalococcoidia bacterium]|jgi:ZIP family zinc transporter|nr:zinc transporter ZupT [Dehalococcoidia bacterium]